ncbi:tetratricopeptide repeat protein [Streptomyces sp. NPDC048623]|uniref:tetratricopeptide repeat protein n=1 Tax=Streptomyces sp. NPDC048623 TaxID=3155761 RepID=UPI00343AFFE3
MTTADPAAGRDLVQADALYDLGRYEQAAEAAARHLAAHPDDASALVLLARCRHRLGDEAQALDLVEQALRAEPDSVGGWLMRTHVLLTTRQYERAEESARRAVALAPHFWATHYTLASVLDRSVHAERKRAAYESARTAVSLAPEESDAHFLVGLTAQRLGNHEVAERAYETALRLDPESSEAHNNLSLLHLRRRWRRPGSWTKAAEGFVQSAALDLDDRQARYNLETMAWGTVAGSRWVALVGFVAASMASAHLNSGAEGREAVIGVLLAVGVMAGGWGGWFLWLTRRVPPRLRRPLLLVSRSCKPVLAMATAVAVLALHSALRLLLWRYDAFGALAFPVFWAAVITYWVSRARLQRRAPQH